jgi:hypothetical protein
MKPTIIEISTNMLLLYRTPMLSLECFHDHKMIHGCDFCIFNLPCKCSISTNDHFVAPRLGSCHKNNDNISIVHPVNLALLQHFFDNTFVKNILADTIFQTAVNVTVPNIKLFEHDMTSVIANDHKAHLSLSKMADIVKHDKIVFQSLAEPLLDGQIQLPSNWPSSTDIIVYCLISVTIILVFLLTWTILRLRKLIILVGVLQKAQPAKALVTNVPSFIYKSAPTDKTVNQNFNLSLDLTWEHANFIVLLTIVLSLVIILYKYLKNRHRAMLCLEIASGKNSVLLDVMHLPLCPSNLNIQTPNQIDDLQLKDSICSSTLMVSWPNFIIKNKMNETILQVENEIPVPIYKVRRLKHVLKKTF